MLLRYYRSLTKFEELLQDQYKYEFFRLYLLSQGPGNVDALHFVKACDEMTLPDTAKTRELIRLIQLKFLSGPRQDESLKEEEDKKEEEKREGQKEESQKGQEEESQKGQKEKGKKGGQGQKEPRTGVEGKKAAEEKPRTGKGGRGSKRKKKRSRKSEEKQVTTKEKGSLLPMGISVEERVASWNKIHVASMESFGGSREAMMESSQESGTALGERTIPEESSTALGESSVSKEIGVAVRGSSSTSMGVSKGWIFYRILPGIALLLPSTLFAFTALWQPLQYQRDLFHNFINFKKAFD
ncbi:hypothetical protein ACOMHN_036673 [Nucella lapillus]